MAGAAAGGAIGAVSAANISAFAGLIGASQSRKFARVEAQKQRDWAERLSSTAYQRSMADMRAGGLNPILAYKTGGAGTPSGATAQGPSHSGLEGVGSSALAGAKLMAELKALKTQRLESESRILLNAALQSKAHSARGLDLANSSYARAQRADLHSRLAGRKAEEKIDNSKAGEFLRGAKRVIQTFSPFAPRGN